MTGATIKIVGNWQTKTMASDDWCIVLYRRKETGARHRATLLGNQGLGSNPGEGMDVFKCTVPSRHGGTLNSRRAASSLVRLVEGEERWEASGRPQNWGGIEQNRTVTCTRCSKR
ncbi:uncharacterized protein TNCV_4983051 [Trichonephila clavipes]|uniref:Uncharacterized protein n=1 Tax=Trichonephila clavipes TaxID=2585209 RepID=A0A8X6WFJ7_TRICX|nr:uncharacterized protein TNCV_4983051 [Trichonephila clavipes]